MGGTLTQVNDGKFSSALPAMSGIVEEYNLAGSPFNWPEVPDLRKAGLIEGQFTSPTEVSGTNKIYLAALGAGRACELGVFDWQAAAP